MSAHLRRAGAERCASHARAVHKFATELLPGLSDFPLLWEGSLAGRATAAAGTPWLCARSLIVGTGDFGFSTVHQLLNGTRRRPPKLLWSDFITHLIARLDGTRPSRLSDSSGLPRRCALSTAASSRRTWVTLVSLMLIHSLALVVAKHGRRAVLSSQYEPLRAHVQTRLKIPTQLFEPGSMSVVDQIRLVGRASISLTPDGGEIAQSALETHSSILVCTSLATCEPGHWCTRPTLRCGPSQVSPSFVLLCLTVQL